TVPFSTSPVGTLLSGVMGTTGLSSSSSFYFDGNGGIWSTATATAPAQFISGTQVGTYSVTSDCVINVTLADVFTTPPVTPIPTPQNSAKLTGLLVKSGTEMYLVYQTPIATGQTAPTTAAALSNRTIVRLVRVISYSNGCSLSTLNGAYALVGSGVGSTTTGTGSTAVTNLNSSNFLSRVRFDGNGKLVSDTVLGTSNLGIFQYTGTYTVNADCSGTMVLNQTSTATSGSTTTTTTTTTNARFLITPPMSIVDGRGTAAFQNTFDLKPGLIFTVSDGTQAINGVGAAQ
ncbi:MAG: hypothetical protein ABI995_04690, partial [Acidobacteriota bacterium]